MKPAFITSLNSDSNWPQGNVTSHSVPFFDSFTFKALIVVAIVVVLIVALRNLRKHTRSLSPLAKTNRDQFLLDELIFDRGITFRRIYTYYSLLILVAIALFMIVHIGVATIVVFFLLLSITGWIYYGAYVKFTKVVINRVDKTISQSSWIGTKMIKPETVKEFQKLIFEKYHNDGYVEYALYIDQVDSSWAIWDGFSKSETQLILDWVRIDA